MHAHHMHAPSQPVRCAGMHAQMYVHAFSAIRQQAIPNGRPELNSPYFVLACTQMSYAYAFSAIHQLAVSLRGALNMKTKDGYKEVCLID